MFGLEWWQITLIAIGGWIALGGPAGATFLLKGLLPALRALLGIKVPDEPHEPIQPPHDHSGTLADDFVCLAHLAERLRQRGDEGRQAAATVVNAATPILLQEVPADGS